MLFDDIDRNELGNDTSSESLFRCLNHYDWPGATQSRNRFESWFRKFPLAHQRDLRERFRSDEDQNHEGAFFELFLHEFLTRLGFSLKVHPEIAGARTRPDFLVFHDDQHFYLEATMVGQRSGPFTRNRNEQDVINNLNTLTSKYFHIGVCMEGTLLRTLGRERVVRPFKELLDAHAPDEVRHLIDREGLFAAPSQKIECGGWSLQGWLKPISPENRSRGIRRQRIVIEPYRATWTDSVAPVRNALKDKARKYRTLDAPLVLAVNARDMFYNGRENDMEVLFGEEQLLYSTENPDLSPVLDRKPNGVWSRASRIDAVLRFQKVDLWNLARASACLYVNPHNTNAVLPDALFRLPHAIGHEGEIEGEDIAQFLGVS